MGNLKLLILIPVHFWILWITHCVVGWGKWVQVLPWFCFLTQGQRGDLGKWHLNSAVFSSFNKLDEGCWCVAGRHHASFWAGLFLRNFWFCAKLKSVRSKRFSTGCCWWQPLLYLLICAAVCQVVLFTQGWCALCVFGVKGFHSLLQSWSPTSECVSFKV